MNNLIAKLEAIPEGEITQLTFKFGDVLEVTNFDQVDESIYNRTDLMVARVREKLRGDKRFHTPGTIIQFSIDDIRSVCRNDGTVLYESNT